MKHNPDDRRDNVDKLQFMINHTIENMEKAEETMELTDDPRQKKGHQGEKHPPQGGFARVQS